MYASEGSSKFGENNKWATFPSASLGWTISNEGFMEGITWLNNLKLRAGLRYDRCDSQMTPYNVVDAV